VIVVGTIGISLFDGAEELDAVGPFEVLAAWTRQWPDDGWRVVTMSQSGDDVTCAKGLTIVPSHSWGSAPPLDVVVYPGGQGTRAQLRDPVVLDWVRGKQATGALMTSVCTGSLVFAAAGLLANRPATTYWNALGLLQELDATIELRPDDRWVDSGAVITAAGVSAGIDMALHLVHRLAGLDRARDVRRYIQYDPEPPV
jgi:transcriptional regulator GlxA family with amidase domain